MTTSQPARRHLRSPTRSLTWVLALTLLLAPAARAGAPYAGRPLAHVLRDLEAQGLRIVFTSHLVRPDMKVAAEPAADAPRQVLDEVLAAHGLRAQERSGGVLVVVPGPPPSEADGDEPVALRPLPFIEDEIVVRPSRVSLETEPLEAPVRLEAQDIETLPVLGRDVFRALSLLPGVAGGDVSARFHLRGGRSDEVQILLDGQELYEAYHLKDFDDALSSVTSQSLSRVSLTTGAFPASQGDRMGGVLDMRTLAPGAERRTQVSLSPVDALALSSGRLGGDGAGAGTGWLLSARRGFVDLSGRALGDEDPLFWDLFGKLEGRPSERHHLQGHGLRAGDRLDFFRTLIDRSSEAFDTDYDASYLWLTDQAILGRRGLMESRVSWSDVTRDRVAGEADDEDAVDLVDRRGSEVWSAGQDWDWMLGERQVLRWGWTARRYDTDYDYTSRIEREGPELVLTGPLAGVVTPLTSVSTTVGRFDRRFTGDHYGGYVTARLTPASPWTFELGLRGDRHELTGETLWSPRLSLAWRATGRHVLRGAWGRFTQSHRPYELQVEDGETAFSQAERSDHWVLGYEGLLSTDRQAFLQALRAEVYRRRIDNPRPRFENLFETLSIFPELEADRVRIDPEQGLAEGVELTVRGAAGRHTGWWLNLATAEAEDVVRLGGREIEIPRPVDQAFAANLNVDHRFGPRWSASAAWRFHTGWPTTPVSLRFVEETGEEEAEEEEPELVPQLVLGRVYGARLSDYHRLDVRVRREWPVRWGRLSVFLDVQNLANRHNTSGFDLELDEVEGPDGEEVEVLKVEEESWPGILPSLGFSVEF